MENKETPKLKKIRNHLNEVEVSKLSDLEFRVMVIKMFKKLKNYRELNGNDKLNGNYIIMKNNTENMNKNQA